MLDHSILEKYSFEETEENLNDVLGRKTEKKELFAAIPSADLDEVLELSNFSAFLFCGGHGCGKTFLTRCYAGTLMENGFSLYDVDCSEILQREEVCGEWESIFEEILLRTNPEGEYRERIYLKLTRFCAVSEHDESIRLIAGYLDRLWEEDCACILAAECDSCDEISLELLDRMSVVELELPDEEDRKAYFGRNFTVEIENPDNANEILSFTPLNFSMDTFDQFCAEHTESLNYCDMERVIQQCKRIWKVKLAEIVFQAEDIAVQLINPKGIRVNEDEFLGVVKRVRKCSANREKIALEAHKKSKVQTAAAPVQTIPTIIQIPAAQPILQTQPISQIQPILQADYISNPAAAWNRTNVSAVPEMKQNSLDTVLERIDDNPMTSDLLQAYNMLPRDQNEKIDMEN